MRASKRSVFALGNSHFTNKKNDTDLPVPASEDVGSRSRKRWAVSSINETDDTLVQIFGSFNWPVTDLGTNSQIEK